MLISMLVNHKKVRVKYACMLNKSLWVGVGVCLKLCLIFQDIYPKYAYNRYAYKEKLWFTLGIIYEMLNKGYFLLTTF